MTKKVRIVLYLNQNDKALPTPFDLSSPIIYIFSNPQTTFEVRNP
jgi:hypothetical protein